MDREIPIEEKRARRRRLMLRYGIAAAAVTAAIVAVIAFAGHSIPEGDLELSDAVAGNLETTVDASGRVAPAFEETVVSPVATRILEVYLQEGDLVEEGTPILRLDLQEAEADVRKMSDELSMRHLSTLHASLDSRTFLTNLEMKIEAKEMAVAELGEEVRNERRLDSLGSGTGDRVRQAELAYRTGKLELEQMRKELANERQAHAASAQSKRLEEGITAKNLEMLQRTLDDARVKAPHAATLTYVNSSIGSSIGPGEKLAVLADLSRFKITAEIPEGESQKLTAGAPATVRIGGRKLQGKVAQVMPQSSNGTVSFTVRLDEESDPVLKSGLKANVSVVYEMLDSVVMIRNGAYYKGPGSYRLFVLGDNDRLERRFVTLGESNFEYVEVKSGIKPGERVAVGDMEKYAGYESLKIKHKK